MTNAQGSACCEGLGSPTATKCVFFSALFTCTRYAIAAKSWISIAVVRSTCIVTVSIEVAAVGVGCTLIDIYLTKKKTKPDSKYIERSK